MIRLTSKIDVSAAAIYFDLRFKTMIEQHLEDLINYEGNVYIDVTPLEAQRWEGNLNGYLHSQQVPVFQHWIIMRMNGMDSTLDFKANVRRLLLPNMEKLDVLRELFTTVHKI